MTVARWDRLARWYHLQEWLEQPGWDTAVDLWGPRRSDVVVDLGCGPGTLARVLARRGATVAAHVGVDASRPMLAQARAVGVEPIVGDVGDVPLGDGCADVVVLGWVLHLLDRPTRIAALGEAARLATGAGVVVTLGPAPPRSPLGRAWRHALVDGLGVDPLRPVERPGDDAGAADLVVRTTSRVGGRGSYRARVDLLARPGPADSGEAGRQSPQP